MKSFRTLALFLGTIVFLSATVIGAATSPAQVLRTRVPADIQKDYDQFIAKFRRALKANDAAAVTEMTKLPFLWNEQRDADYFRKNLYREIFTAEIRACIARNKGVYDRAPDGSDHFTVFCGEELFLFSKTPDGFRFVEVGVND
jgi:hypothetical protein